MVYYVYNAVKIPIVGMGGVSTAEDAIELMMAGAKAVAVGTANFTNPLATQEIISGLTAYLEKNNIADVNEIVGMANK